MGTNGRVANGVLEQEGRARWGGNRRAEGEGQLIMRDKTTHYATGNRGHYAAKLMA